MTSSHFSHLTLCVRDLRRATDFYSEVFDFAVAPGSFVGEGPSVEALLEVPEAHFEAVFLVKDGVFLELITFTQNIDAHPGKRLDNEYGYVHVGYRVADMDDTCRRVVKFGGEVLTATRQEMAMAGAGAANVFQFVHDPDGNRLLLTQHGDEANRLAHREYTRTAELGWAEPPIAGPAQTHGAPR